MSSTSVAGNGAPLWRNSDPATFEATILAAANQLGIQSLAVLKDYWACEALRAIESNHPGQVIFKGGTSLEKLRIIDRFSEDLDLLVISEYPTLALTKNAMREMCRAAKDATNGTLDHEASGGENGKAHKSMYLTFPVNKEEDEKQEEEKERGEKEEKEDNGLADPGRILLEFGQSGGSHPSSYRTVTSLVSRSLDAAKFNISGYGDLTSFEVQILHPGRTLIEKLLRVNNFALMEGASQDRHGWPRIGRQFYDLWQLLGNQEVIEFLTNKHQASGVLQDCFKVSQDFTPDQLPPTGGFAESPIFDSSSALFGRLSEEHNKAMRTLYFGKPMDLPLTTVFERIRTHRELLDILLV